MQQHVIKIFLLALTLSLTLPLAAQQKDTLRQPTPDTLLLRKDTLLTVRGHVVGESDEETLPGAHIYLGTNKQPTTVTNATGDFVLERVPAGELYITASFVGYKPTTRRFIVRADTNVGRFQLLPEVLDEVLITATPPLITQNGDTTQFNAAAVKIADDAYLEDLLKKLPGFQIVDNKLMVNGEEVEKLYVDGTEYFLSNPMQALQTLPANLVDKIKMYDDKSEKAKFSGFDDGTRHRSLNIETKNPNQLKVFGNLTLGHSISEDISNTLDDNNYNLSANANAFSRVQRISVNASTSRTSQGDELPDPIYRGKGGDNTSQSASIDYSRTFKKNTDLGGGYRYNNSESYSASITRQDYFPTDLFDSRILNNESHSWSNSQGHNVNIRFSSRNFEARNQLSFSPSFSRNVSDSRSLSLGNSIENSDTLNITNSTTRNHSVSTSASGALSWSHRFARGRVLFLNLNASLSENTGEGTQQDSSIINHRDTLRNLVNNNRSSSNSLSASATYTEHLGEHVSLSLDYSFTYNNNESRRESASYRDAAFTQLIGLDSALTNTTTQTRLEHNLSLGSTYYRDRLNLSARLGVRLANQEMRYAYLNAGDSLVNNNYLDLSPGINLTLHIDSIRSLTASYNGNTSSPDASDLQDVLDVTDQLHVSRGNPSLKKTFSQNLNISYRQSHFSENSYNFLNVSLRLSNTINQRATATQFLTRDTVINGYTLLKGATYSTPVNLNGTWSASATVSYSFNIPSLKLNLYPSLSYSYNRRPSINDNVKNYSNSHSASFSINIVSNISENLDFNINSSTAYSTTSNTAMDGSSTLSESVSANVNWTTWKNFTLGGDYSFSYTLNMQQQDITTTNSTLNLELGKKFLKQKQLHLRFRALDILRQHNIENYSLQDTYASTSYHTTPRNYYTISLSYRFNSMNKALRRSR